MKRNCLRGVIVCLFFSLALSACSVGGASLSFSSEPSSSYFGALSSEWEFSSSFVENSSVQAVRPSANSAHNGASSKPASIQQKTLKGVVTGLTDKVVTVTDSDGRVYLFARDDSLVDQAGGPMKMDCAITVTYCGGLVISEALQTVHVLGFYLEKPQDAEQAQSDSAQTLLSKMTLQEKVGQMFLVRCPQKDAASIASKYQFGGYVLFGRDFKDYTKAQVVSNIQSYQTASKIPMLIAVDEEGGTVNRISAYPQFRAVPFWSSQDLYKEGGWPLIRSDTTEKCNLLSSLGINLNLAPVCDISTNASDYIYARSFGKNAAETAEYVKTVVSTMRANNMGCALKHFPGYGNNADTHTGIARDERSIEQFWQNDFLPFQSGIEAGAPIVLVSHNIVVAIDGERPASLSPAVHTLLREELNFSGLIMTDDLSMDAIRQYTDGEQAAVQAVLAGNDLLCCTDYETQYPAVLNAVQSGKISESRINESVLRILRYKIEAGII